MVERRWAIAAIFHNQINYQQNSKKMEKTKAEIKDEKKLQLTEIKDTPFTHATDGERNYIICGKVLLENGKTKEETKEWLKEKPWEAIGMLIQGIAHEMIKESKKNN